MVGDGARALLAWAGAVPKLVPAPTPLLGSTAGSKEKVLESDQVQTRCLPLALGECFLEVSVAGPPN